ncbi:MAG: hypothetical protein KC442_02780 [Thermomicrobiales bacterium]|nr:hypothetical protein [Thermomicrobiales bacterium]
MTAAGQTDRWPPLDLNEWRATKDTLHLWTQVVGKLKVELAPFENHLWHTALTLTARGLTTGPLPLAHDVLQADFDFLDHNLTLSTGRGGRKAVPLYPRPVALFYAEVMGCLAALGAPVALNTMPQELPDAIPFDQDTVHESYDADAVARWWRILQSSSQVMSEHRRWFTGKASPVLFYWGSFDLATARYNGVPCAPPKGGGYLFRVAECETNWTAGFWPGSGAAPYAAFYAYAYPQPAGIEQAAVQPERAFWSSEMREFLLPYEDVRTLPDPDAAFRAFLESTYDAAANLSGWDRRLLELKAIPAPR